MIVSLWMSRNVIMVEAKTLITAAAALMTRKQIRRLPVVNQGSKGAQLIGMISNADIYRAFPPEINPFSIAAQAAVQSSITVGEVMKTGSL